MSAQYRIRALILVRDLYFLKMSEPSKMIHKGYVTKTDYLNRVPTEAKRKYFLALQDLIEYKYVYLEPFDEGHYMDIRLTAKGMLTGNKLANIPDLEELLD